jgi:chemotaxis protein methyltransferase CheR
VIVLPTAEREAVARYVHGLCGVVLDQSKDYLIAGRLGGLLEETGAADFGELVSRARADRSRALDRRIVDAITTGETLFFRDASPFELLRHKIVPELVDRRRPIRIWSAACSTGQELYSIAILLKELLGDPERYRVRLLGTDISDQAVARASRGWYGEVEIARGLNAELRARYFVPLAGGWQVRDEIRAMASFQKRNLLEDFSALGRFEVIFCRNVAIYFNNQDRAGLFARMARSLEPDGCLLVGAMESLAGIGPQFESMRHLRSVYYRPAARPGGSGS